MPATQGELGLRAENVDRAVKGFALQEYRMKQVLLVQNSSSWAETFYKETAADLTAGGTRNIRRVSRGASFPYVEPTWTPQTGRHEKYAAEGIVFMEDRLTDAIDVQARTLLRVARSIAKAVDDAIYAGLSGATGIGTAAATATWNNSTIANREPIEDILKGIQNMAENNYDALANGFLLVSPKDYVGLLSNSKVINNPSFKSADVVTNGRVGQLLGLNVIVSNSVTADEAMIIIGQRAATWKSAAALTTAVIEDKGIKFTIRSWEIGQLQVTDELGIYLITNTQEP